MTCEFCGQVLLDRDECNCIDAMQKKKIKERIELANNAMGELFIDNLPEDAIPLNNEMRSIIEMAIIQIAHSNMRKLQIELPGGVKLKLSVSTKGTIKIERSVTEKSTAEIEE